MSSRFQWAVAAPYFDNPPAKWLDDLITDERLSFEKIFTPRSHMSWHSRKSAVTSSSEWLTHLRQAFQAFRRRPDGVITSFPQLAMCAGLIKKFGRSKPAIIAYNYNLGELRAGRRQKLARLVADQIDIYVVHSPQEVESYAEYLGLPRERFRFVPLQRGQIPLGRQEDSEKPFILAMGSAKRDYPTLLKAVDELGIPTVIVTKAADIQALPASPHVRFLSDLSQMECLELLSRARISVTPLSNLQTASGQITFVNAMQLGVPVIATRSPGTDGYIDHEHDGLLVEAGNVQDLTGQIRRLWNDAHFRDVLGQNALHTAAARFSDKAAAQSLQEMVLGLQIGEARAFRAAS
ncbi:glycosyltransferase family 4 protein [Paracoccus caeni]|uniref:Glycosyltransferase family 4 protein n=2 Tax=Paracoccus caeni TaxID=657651 RepID=A0A934SMV8_9RHOB|nr:glycosyltransferase family 4 protein [Paracoccus caeni]